MAFFSAQDGTRYFSCFYASDGANFSGTFHVLTDRAANTLATIYQCTVLVAAGVLLLELFTPLFFRSFNPEQRALFFGLLFILNALAIMPAALFIATQPKISLAKKPLHVEVTRSLFVYGCVILVPANYTVMMLWKALYDSASLFLPMALALTAIAAAGSIFRIGQLRRNPRL